MPWIRCQGRGAAGRPGGDARLDELPLSGDLTRVGVDEEHRHARRRLARAAPGWDAALRAFDATCAAAARPRSTRRAYGDRPRAVRRLGRRARGIEPEAIGYLRALRRYAAALSAARRGADHGGAQARGAARASSARWSSTARSSPTRPTSCPRPSAPSACRGRSRPTRSPALLDRIPADARRSSCATARCSSSPTRAGCAPRSSSPSTSSRVDFDAETGAGRGQGRQDAHRAGRRARAARASSATSSARRPALDRRRATSARCSCPSRGAGSPPPTSAGGCERWARAGGRPGGRVPALAAPLLRDPPARGRRRSAGDPGASGPRQLSHDADLHSGRVERASRSAYARAIRGL